jgi:uncharacterized protein YdaU (DUF1376 family)
MAIQKPEWFKIDAAKFLSDTLVDAMSPQELGACIRLLCRQWIDGFVPDDMHLLARLCRLDGEAMAEAWVILSNFFPAMEPGKRANRFMWIERERVVADLERKSSEGTRAARKRWDNVREHRDSEPSGLPNAEPNGLGIAAGNGPSMPAAMQDQTRADQRGNENSERPPEGLNGFQYAAGLLEQLGQVATRAVLPIVADSIRLLAKREGITEAEATDVMKRRAEEARASGESVNRFWFEDGKWQGGDLPPAQPPKATMADVERILREQREGVEQVWLERQREKGVKA